MSTIHQFIISYIFRSLNAFLVYSYFQPDEYYQVWEPAYFRNYGVGFLSWEWKAQMRTTSLIHLFSFIMDLSDEFQIDQVILAKFFMAGVASLIDVFSGLVAQQITKRRKIGKYVWLLSLGSCFNWYVSTRPFSNTFELMLTITGMYLWLYGSVWSNILAQFLAQIAISLRPSNALLWIQLGLEKLLSIKSITSKVWFILGSLFIATCAQSFIFVMDALTYSNPHPKVPIVEFFRYNIVDNLSVLYGSNSWNWYFVQGIPFLLLAYIIYLPFGLKRTPKLVWRILLINLLVMSTVVHKEFRFIFYLLPLLHIVVAYGLDSLPRFVVYLCVVVNLVVGCYLGTFHKTGVMNVVDDIKHSNVINDVSFLMPCHSTPWQAHFQRKNDPNFSPKFLTCEPPWRGENKSEYLAEDDLFYRDIDAFMVNNPLYFSDYIVIYDELELYFASKGYKPVKSYFNGLFSDDSRRGGNVVLMEKRDV